MIAHDQAAHGTITDGDEKRFIADGGVREHAFAGFAKIQAVEEEFLVRTGLCFLAAVHARRFTEENFQRHIDGLVVEMEILDREVFLFSGLADDGKGGAFAGAEFGKRDDAIGGDGEDVAFL